MNPTGLTNKPITRRGTKPIFAAILCAVLATACAAQPDKSDRKEPPQEERTQKTSAEESLFTQTVKVRKNNSDDSADPEGSTVVEKNVATIIANNRAIWINKVRVKDLKELEEKLKQGSSPVISIATHKCLDGATATKIMSIAQDAADTPIAFSSYGELDDEQCQQ